MTRLRVEHRTIYRYGAPVGLAPHRLMLRPREDRDLRIVSWSLRIVPAPALDWSDDVFGNLIATASFEGTTDELVIEAEGVLEHAAAAWPVFPIAASAVLHPFRYSDDERIDLGPLVGGAPAEGDDRLAAWTRAFVRSDPTDTLSLLKDLCAGIAGGIRYEARDDEGTQTPRQTLDRQAGSCRDLATLFAAAARSLGIGARLASGYLRNDAVTTVGSVGVGTTHAWAEVYIPGAGWIAFDATNNSVGRGNLITVAVGRTMDLIAPISGRFVSSREVTSSMQVDVSVAVADGMNN